MQEQHSFRVLSYTIIHHVLHPIQVPQMLQPNPWVHRGTGLPC